ncbi:MAG: BamA/TamA family outer membrane protein [Myxococcota bacterium]
MPRSAGLLIACDYRTVEIRRLDRDFQGSGNRRPDGFLPDAASLSRVLPPFGPKVGPHRVLFWLLLLLIGGCASIPQGRYGIESLDIDGVDTFDERALAACLATHERDSFSVNLGREAVPECGVPPFDDSRVRIEFWRWPWTDWPLLDPATFERDLERIQRWYRARGYYEARVLSVTMDPPDALERDRLPRRNGPDGTNGANGDADDEAEESEDCEGDCEVAIAIRVEEGEPILVASVVTDGIEHLAPALQQEIEDTIQLRIGERFDEAIYDASKEAIAKGLADNSYAHSRIRGQVEIDPEARTASIRFEVDSGPPCQFGEVTVEANEGLDPGVITAVAFIDEGDRFSRQALGDAQRAIYALGAFSSVEVEPVLPEDRSDTRIPVRIRAVPGRLVRYGLGAGIASGTFDLLDSQASNEPRWDVHLLAFTEFRDFLGGLRRARLEWRPRVIFQEAFPDASETRLGSQVRLEFRQPSFLEPRTTLAFGSLWDFGPDPFDDFFRHDFTAFIGPERSFFDGRLFAAFRIRSSLLFPVDEGPDVPENNQVTLLEQFLRLDLRDNPRDPSFGFYAEIAVQEAGFFLPSSWDYLRLTPDVRFYVPLPLGLVIAARFSLGMMFIINSSSNLDDESAFLGPERYRLRGGGANSNRGYLPGDLGDSDDGGLRRWNASLELRIPLTQNFGITLFADAGDVHAGQDGSNGLESEDPRFRFNVPHISFGGGIRYDIAGIRLRFDIGWAVPGLQDLTLEEGQEFRPPTNADLFLFEFPGALHLTIGEAF